MLISGPLKRALLDPTEKMSGVGDTWRVRAVSEAVNFSLANSCEKEGNFHHGKIL